jgi:nucleotide-binding universal stress UspA family protein
MIEIRRILCPIDFSEHSRHAFGHAVAIARRYESAITALYVFTSMAVAAGEPGVPVFDRLMLSDRDRDRLLADLKSFAAGDIAPGVAVDYIVREGGVVAEILAQAQAMHADLLAMGTHGRSGFERLILGSVTEKVLRKAVCPVLTVPPRQPDVLPASPVVFKRILCPVDFSDCSMAALRYALSLAQEADATLTLVSVMSDELTVTPDMYGAILAQDRQTLGEYKRRQEDETRQKLSNAVPASAREYCQLTTMVTRGRPSYEILRIAAEQPSDVIIMGVRGRGAADVLVFGSTTNHVVRHAVCPVLTVRQC